MDFTKTTAPKGDGCSINQLEKRQTVGLYCPGQYTVQHIYKFYNFINIFIHFYI